MVGPWQNKILFTLFMFGAGFVTAVYMLTPCPVTADPSQRDRQQAMLQESPDGTAAQIAEIDVQDWAVKIRSGIDISIDFAEEYALRAADLIRSKMGQGNDQNG